jgi:hypothetical protein
MFSIKHAVRNSEFIRKHPIVTYALMAAGAATLVEGFIKATGKTPSTAQPTPTAGA